MILRQNNKFIEVMTRKQVELIVDLEMRKLGQVLFKKLDKIRKEISK